MILIRIRLEAEGIQTLHQINNLYFVMQARTTTSYQYLNKLKFIKKNSRFNLSLITIDLSKTLNYFIYYGILIPIRIHKCNCLSNKKS